MFLAGNKFLDFEKWTDFKRAFTIIYNNKYSILYLKTIMARRVIFRRISGILILWLELPPLLPLPVAKYQSVKLLNQLINQLIHQFAVRKSALERMHREDPRSC